MRDSVSLSYPASRFCPHFLIHGSPTSSKSAMVDWFLTLHHFNLASVITSPLTLLLLSSIFIDLTDYIGSTWIEKYRVISHLKVGWCANLIASATIIHVVQYNLIYSQVIEGGMWTTLEGHYYAYLPKKDVFFFLSCEDRQVLQHPSPNFPSSYILHSFSIRPKPWTWYWNNGYV